MKKIVFISGWLLVLLIISCDERSETGNRNSNPGMNNQDTGIFKNRHDTAFILNR